jgi:hypothetical protein
VAADGDAAAPTIARDSDTHDVRLPDDPLAALDFGQRYARERLLGEGATWWCWSTTSDSPMETFTSHGLEVYVLDWGLFVASLALMLTAVFPISRVHDAMEELGREMVPEAVRRPTDPTIARARRPASSPGLPNR